jgi:L-aminopeptidase/D-esterase-like protein
MKKYSLSTGWFEGRQQQWNDMMRIWIRILSLTGLMLLVTTSFAQSPILDSLEGVATHEDGRAPVQALYASYLQLLDHGWSVDVVYDSRPAGTGQALPIIALRSPRQGPATWFISGIHGEEPAGPNAIAASIDALVALGELQPVVLLPLCNPQGYVRNWRYLNLEVYSETVDEMSVGDSSHLLPDPDQPASARADAASSPEAEALGQYILRLSASYPPVISIDLHEDNLIEKGYVYSQGEAGAGDELALAARQVLEDNGIPLELNGKTRFDETIVDGIIGPVVDSSVDELMSSARIIVNGQAQSGPAARTVLVFETPAKNTPLDQRISAHQGLVRKLTRIISDSSADKARARDLGIPFDGTPGKLNAITDVAGVEVGHSTIIRGEGPLQVGTGPVRTGVTAVFPLGKASMSGVAAGIAVFNGDGEMTGSHFIEEFGELHGPVSITNTLSVGAVHSAVIEWNRQNVTLEDELYARGTPMVAETWDGFLNDIYGQHVHQADVFRALESASGGPVAEGNVGGGTGMRAFRFAGGIGTASRRVETEFGTFTLGVLVQANFGARSSLLIAGVPVGREITDLLPEDKTPAAPEGNSIVVVIGTDAPLIPTQLKRLARRATLGLGRVGSNGHSGSGDVFVAFSSGNPMTAYLGLEVNELRMLPDMDPLFEATVQATEEAIINALVAATTLSGVNGNTLYALPHERVRQILRQYNRLED